MRNCQNNLPKWLFHFAFPPAVSERSCSSTSLQAFGVVSVFGFLQFQYVIYDCSNLHFLVEYVFHLYGSFLLLLHELPALIFWLFFYQELDIFLSSLVIPFYIMSINSLCVKLVANTFSNLSFILTSMIFCM